MPNEQNRGIKQTKHIYEFGPFRAIPSERILVRSGERVALTAKAFDVLIAMIRNRGHLVEKSALMTAVWTNSFVEEGNLAVTISMLRKALGEDTGEHKYIQTVPGHGYRFVANVREIAEIRSLAVLPFKNANPSQESGEFLGAGLADSIITRLVSAGQIVVRSTSAVLRYAEKNVAPAAVGREQKVDAVITGRIDHSSNRIRVAVEMIWTKDASLMWAKTFEEDPQRIYALGEEIAEMIMQLTSTAAFKPEQKHPVPVATRNAAAYRLYLQGRYFWNKRTQKGLLRSIEFFRQATKEDPGLSIAYVGLADSYVLLGSYGVESPQRICQSAKDAASKALELDDSLAEAHASLGMISFYYEWDWTKAETEFQKAIALNPNYAITYEWYAITLAALGKHKEAVEQIRQAQALDPLSLIINTAVGRIYYFGRQYDSAIRAFQEVFDLDPQFARAHKHLGMVHAARGSFDEAIREFEEARRLSSFDPYLDGVIGYSYASSGNKSKARKVLESLTRSGEPNTYVPAFSIALIHIGLDDLDRAFEYLRKSWQDRSAHMVFAKTDPLLDRVRGDARFGELLRLMKLD
jgi:DNA-binding winged helix-turn-helix (wHTH) protein/Flp pilus assembly protein TadD